MAVGLVDALVADVGEAKTTLMVIGAAVIGVWCAIWVIWQIRYKLIEREASREYFDRYGR